MSRQKQKGTAFETAVVRYLRAALADKQIDRMILHGSADEGDIRGVQFLGRDIVLECKDTRTLALTEHLREAQAEAANHRDAGHPTQCGVLIQHAPGIGISSHAGDQWCVMRLEDLAQLIKFANTNLQYMLTGVVS
jgi:hypothetical protein